MSYRTWLDVEEKNQQQETKPCIARN